MTEMLKKYVEDLNSAVVKFSDYGHEIGMSGIPADNEHMVNVRKLIKFAPFFDLSEVVSEWEKINPKFLSYCYILKHYNKNGQYCVAKEDANPRESMFDEFFKAALVASRWNNESHQERVNRFADLVNEMDNSYKWNMGIDYACCVAIIEDYLDYVAFLTSHNATNVNRCEFLKDVVEKLNADYGYNLSVDYQSFQKILSIKA